MLVEEEIINAHKQLDLGFVTAILMVQNPIPFSVNFGILPTHNGGFGELDDVIALGLYKPYSYSYTLVLS